jgi:hypothetical protein
MPVHGGVTKAFDSHEGLLKPWRRFEFFDHFTRAGLNNLYAQRLGGAGGWGGGAGTRMSGNTGNLIGNYSELAASSGVTDWLEELRLMYSWQYACRLQYYEGGLIDANYTVRFGVGRCGAGGADLGHGTYFEHIQDGAGTLKMFAVVNNMGARTTQNLAVNPNFWPHKYRIVPSATRTIFYYDNMVTPIATIVAAMPTNQDQNIFFQVKTDAGAHTMYMQIDWLHVAGLQV